MSCRRYVPIIAMALAACASTTAPDPDAPRSVDDLAIAPFAIHELCMKLAAGDGIDWRFQSNAPLAFNIHYHDGPSVVLPVMRDASLGDFGIYRALIAHDYCAMWEAGPVGAVISYRVRPIRAKR